MIRKTTAFLGVTVLLLLAGMLAIPTTYADGIDGAVSITDKAGDEFDVTGQAELTRGKNHINIEASVQGLAHGHVFSVWAEFNGGAAFNLTGFESDDNGNATLGGKVNLNKKVVLNAFKITIKDHGEPVQGRVHKQKSTKDFNCTGSCPTRATATW